ncbi:tyrosine-protein phosphatase non-receptor type 1-like isoform X2 [Ostrea edulis]|uniref:tyrosine-protein phosphatase non-receptor type 1-like isoform X2 n=1 Tax=Ostrea edulis TaxID=37623 RepID=UPI00209623EA|nr:tyrosine-protein phosphatase non-receptor type 1-like isoform X2 [Ostrea edulis]
MGSEIENEFVNYDKYNAWGPVYQELKNEASIQAMEEEFSTAEARNAVNRNKNRYRDVSPYDHSRVKLSNNVYINASLVEVKEANRKYILTQGPLEVTVSHFWQMVWEKKSKAIIMLNKLIENGARKCYKYYPTDAEDDEDEIEFEDVSLNVSVIKETQLDYYIERILLLKHTESEESREVIHYNYTHWPDFGVPQSPLVFLNFLMTVRQSGALETDVGPAIVHCSAGIGRSGTFCLVDSSLVIIEKTQNMNSVDVRNLLLEMRKYRMGLIQTADQLRFSYLAIIDGGHQILSSGKAELDIFSDYLKESINKEDHPPTPPERTTSLPIDRQPPPLPPRSPDLRKTDNEDEEKDYENQRIAPKDTEQLIPEKEKENSSTFRRRIQREERKQKTQDQINRMKEKQRKSELWRNRRSYLTPVAIGITLFIGGLLLYKYYF